MKKGILGGLSGKVGPTVGTSWKGIPVLKSMPVSVHNPRTPAQVLQRQKFARMSKFSSIFLSSLIKPFWDKHAVRESGFNSFMKVNLPSMTPQGALDFTKIKLSNGTLPHVPGLVVEAISPAQIDFAWTNSDYTADNPADLMSFFVYNEDDGRCVMLMDGDDRASLGFLINLPASFVGDTVHCFLVGANADGSNTFSEYAGQLTVL